MGEHTLCQDCTSKLTREDGVWVHAQAHVDHEAIPFHADDWPTDGVIGPFGYKYDFLSNFYEKEIRYNGDRFASSEHAYQAMKARHDTELYEQIVAADEPHEAKELGQRATLPLDWDEEKTYVMVEVVTAKFSQHPDLRDDLVETGTQTLVELNWWDDTYWGADITTGEGRNMLGRILMHVRSTFQSIRL